MPHAYQLYLAIEDIDHTKTRAYSPQTNGICERFQKTMLDEFYRIAFRKKIYRSLDELQVDGDAWLHNYNHDRSHSGRYCYGKTPMQTFVDSKQTALDKQLDQHDPDHAVWVIQQWVEGVGQPDALANVGELESVSLSLD